MANMIKLLGLLAVVAVSAVVGIKFNSDTVHGDSINDQLRKDVEYDFNL